jgi:hypothetical protein
MRVYEVYENNLLILVQRAPNDIPEVLRARYFIRDEFLVSYYLLHVMNRDLSPRQKIFYGQISN